MALTMKERGYRDFSLEPAYTDISDLKWRDSDIESIKSQYKELAEQYIHEVKKREPFNFFHFNIMMESADKQTFNTIQCGAGLGYLGVSAEGGIYPCHKLVGDERYKMGDIFNGISADDIQKQFMQAHVFDKEKCLNCWAKYVCGGGCNAYNIFFNDNIREPYHIECEMMRYRIELGTYIYSELTTHERRSLGYLSQQASHGKCPSQSKKCSFC
jgi:uncharacterized protein